jgi:FtsZ-interacting cell division protein ZipA
MMTSLQIILAVVGIVFVVAVVAYNLWQERKYRKEATRLFSTKREDILLGESVSTENQGNYSILPEADRDDGAGWRLHQATRADRVEMRDRFEEPRGEGRFDTPAEAEEPAAPRGLGGVPEPRAASPLPIQVEGPIRSIEDDDLVMPTHATTVPPPRAPAPPPPPPARAIETGRFQPESGLDEQIEYIARLRFAQPSLTAYAALLEGVRRLGKPVRAMGKRPGEGWEPLGAHTSNAYEALEFGILLADRNGALTGEQLERFCRLLYDFAAAQGGAVSCPDKQSALQSARDMDAFCMEVDVLIGLTVQARENQPFQGAEIHRLAAEAGLRLGRDGVFHLMDAQGHALYSLANQEERPFVDGGGDLVTHGVTLLFDVPRVRDGLTVFDRMTGLGLRLAESLGGSLVDDNGRQVNQDNLQRDRKRLGDYYARMRERGIEAGGERALRLFA